MDDKDINVIIKASLDMAEADAQLTQFGRKAEQTLAGVVVANAGGQPTQAAQTAQALEGSRESQLASDKASDLLSKVKGFRDTLKGAFDQDDPDYEEKNKKTRAYMQVASMGVSSILNILKGFTTASLGLVTGIYDRMKAASPLLQAIESLFQLAMTLFFMPLGNKIAEVMLPAVLRLLDGVMGIWDMFSGASSLGEIFEIAIINGLQYLGDFFKSIGEDFKEEKGLLGSIGRTLYSVGEFIQNSGYDVVETLFNVASFVVEHIKGIISAIITMTGLHYSLMLGLIAATVSSGTWGPILGVTAAGVGLGAGALGLRAYKEMSDWEVPEYPIKMAEGGYVPAQEGGSLRVLGEGGEGEYVIPESKMGHMGSVTNNFYIEGVTSEELGRMIDERVNSQISLSRIRSGF